MDKQQLDRKLEEWAENLLYEDKKFLLTRISSLKSAYPFNEYEYRLIFLLDKNIITFNEYEVLRDAYIKSNPYLNLYSIGPRSFGDMWGKKHLTDIDVRFKNPSKQADKNYSGEYDLYLDSKNRKGIIKIEVKASRAVHKNTRGALEAKPLRFGSEEPYWMNFQQLKFNIADIFIFIGVWVDKIVYWVFTNKEAKEHPSKSRQHRGGIEYQIGITNKNFNNFKKFMVDPEQLFSFINSKVSYGNKKSPI